ncbi:MAG: TolC family protein [Candidatus Rokuibacteriota bacterium]
MSGRRILLLTVVCSSLVLEAWRATAQDQRAPGVYTIDALVTTAIRDNPEVAAARAEVDAARGRVTQAGLRPNPMLELGGQKALSPDNNVTVGVTLPLDLNGRKAGRVGVAERELEMKQAQFADRERRLTAEVRMKAADLLAARRDLQVTDDLLSANREALGLVGERVRRGAVPALEENLLLVEVNRLDASRRLLESRAEIFSLQLRALAALPAEAPFSLVGEIEAGASIPDRGVAVAQALEQRADLRAARAEGAMARAKVLKEQAEGRWDASVSLGYQRQETGFGLNGLTDRGGTRPIQDTFHYFGGGVSIMLPVRNQNQGNVAAARAEAVAAERRVELASLVVRQEVASAFTQYDATRRSLEIYARGVRDVARQNLDVVRRTYQLGRATLLDVIGEQRRYIEIEMGYTEALKQVYGAAVEIERALGGPAR